MIIIILYLIVLNIIKKLYFNFLNNKKLIDFLICRERSLKKIIFYDYNNKNLNIYIINQVEYH